MNGMPQNSSARRQLPPDGGAHFQELPHVAYSGPERRQPGRRSDGELTPWLLHLLDEFDHGALLVAPDARVLYLNQAARLELAGAFPLQWHTEGGAVCARLRQDEPTLRAALRTAAEGERVLVMLGNAAHRACVSIVPLVPRVAVHAAAAGEATAADPHLLLALGRHQACDALAVQAFGRSVGLTPAETRALGLLCAGVAPAQIAHRHGVALSTVRTQIANARAKAGVASMRELVRVVAVLPPLGCARRMALGPQPLPAQPRSHRAPRP